MFYVYFVGCTSIEEVKTKYKQQAKIHHPDTVTGSNEKFVALKNEFDHILEGRSIFPIKNLPKIPNLDTEEIFYEVRNGKMRTPKEEPIEHLDPKELFRQRAINFYKNLRVGDVAFDQIDALIQQAKEERFQAIWVYHAVQKLDELNLDHFKYVTFILDHPISNATLFFKKYQLSKVS